MPRGGGGNLCHSCGITMHVELNNGNQCPIFQVADLQQRKCSVIFDISCSLARILEFFTREIPHAFLMGPDMNLRRLAELVVFILNHIILAADAEFFDM